MLGNLCHCTINFWFIRKLIQTFNKNLKNYDHIFRYEEKNLKKSFGFFLRTFFAFV